MTRPTSVTSSTKRCRPLPESRTRAPSLPSRHSDSTSAELAFPPDHKQPGSCDDRGTDKHQNGRYLAKYRVAEDEGPHDRRIVERGDHRGGGVAVTFSQQNMRDTAHYACSN